MTDKLVLFAAGLVTMGFLVAGTFFLRFWKRTHDELFLSFAAAFVLLAINQAIGAVTQLGRDEIGWLWLLRVAAFLLIISAIVRKNIGPNR
jgi:uncharacterized membrane protein HdeD (DUF308 family)